jgi:hypothetical protein
MEVSRNLEPLAELISGDRRLTIRLMGFWQATRVGAERCARADDFLATLPDELMGDCCMAVLSDGGEWELRDIGDDIARVSGITGPSAKLFDVPPGSVLAEAVRDLDDAFNFISPIVHEGETRDENGCRAVFRSILLPLADNQGRVMQVLAAARCGAVPRLRPLS